LCITNKVLEIGIKEMKIMYSINCNYYEKQFESIDDLLEDITISGQDPNYEITKNGKGIGEMVIDLIVF
jgi:predicted transcriptional regulator